MVWIRSTIPFFLLSVTLDLLQLWFGDGHCWQVIMSWPMNLLRACYFGVGMIAACVSTVAASSGHFLLIPKNAAGSKSDGTPLQAYSSLIGNCLIAVPLLLTVLGFIWSVTLLRSANITPHYVAGHVLLGLTAICACLIGLVATIVHQTRNTFSEKEHWLWCYWVILLGTLTVIQGSTF